MSFDALAWVAKCKPGSASRKLVLFALADRHHTEDDVAYPSVAWIEEFTGLNRKTIITAISDLERLAFISDTGQRKGKTGQVKVYRLHLETVPKPEQSQNRNSTDNSEKQSQNRDTETVTDTLSPTVSTKPTESASDRLSIEEFEEGWRALSAELGIPGLRGKLRGKRLQAFKARVRDYPPDDFVEAFERIRSSPFLRGEQGNWRGATVEFFLRPETINKILEGSFDGRTAH